MVVSVKPTLVLTEEQKRDFDEKGYIILEDFFRQTELDLLHAAIGDVGSRIRKAKKLTEKDHWSVRNALAHHEAFLDLVDHPKILPYVVDTIGWNVQIRTTHLDYRPPYPPDLAPGELGRGKGADHAAGYRNLVWHSDLCGPYLFEAPSLDGYVPFMEIKVGYYLSDLTEHNSGALATDDHVLGGDPDWEPSSQQWIPKNWDNVPLKQWAKEQVGRGDRKMDKVLHL